MKYVIYKITNKINGKIYLGKHQTANPDDNYMGSGKILKYAQSKYGIENFIKEILHIFDTKEEMNTKEAEIVTEEFCLREDTYNICVGGKGGFSYINRTKTPEQRKKSAAAAALHTNKLKQQKYGNEWRSRSMEAAREKRRYLLEQGIIDYNRNGFTGKHTNETKKIISDKAKERLKEPSNNSQYGTLWITDGSFNRKIKSVDIIPEGWYKGRVIKPHT